MPKGVEHKIAPARGVRWIKVKIPMMPKGVEHVQLARVEFLEQRSEDSNDAERR